VGWNGSTLAELSRIRAHGQRPDGFVVVGAMDAAAWAARNRFFFVDERDLGDDDLTAFAGLDVVIRTAHAFGHRDLAQLMAMACRYLTIFDTRTNYSEFFSV